MQLASQQANGNDETEVQNQSIQYHLDTTEGFLDYMSQKGKETRNNPELQTKEHVNYFFFHVSNYSTTLYYFSIEIIYFSANC